MNTILIIIFVVFLILYFNKRYEHYDDRMYIRTEKNLPIICTDFGPVREPSYKIVDDYSLYPYYKNLYHIEGVSNNSYYPSLNYAFGKEEY